MQSSHLRHQAKTEEWFAANRPDAVFLAAVRVGGILANDRRPAEFLHDNLMIEANVIHTAHRFEVETLLLLGSSCIYPKFAPQPLTEDDLLTGPPEPTNQWYAVAKIAGIVGYGGGWRFDPSKPDGTLRKRLDVSRLDALGWRAQTPLEHGLAQIYAWYLEALEANRLRA
jgi:nucleoside-diphosphate-sugar epimerase